MLAVAGAHLAEPHFAGALQGQQATSSRIETGQKRVVGLGLIHEGDTLIRLESCPLRRGQLSKRQPPLPLELLHRRSAGHQLTHPGVEVGDVDLVGGVVLRREAHRIGLDAQVGVFGHQHHRWLVADQAGAELLERHRQDVVVAIAALQFRRQLSQGFTAAEHHLQGAAAGVVDRHAIGQVALLPQRIQQPGDLAGITALLGGVTLEAVDLLHHLDRDHHRVVFKAGERLRVVEQHIRIENEGLAHHGPPMEMRAR